MTLWVPSHTVLLECIRLWDVPCVTLGGKLHLAPIPEDVQNVLDIGTGTGIWAMDFADEHPSARVIGTDLSPIQPGLVPPNLKFLIDDAESDWEYNHKFDFIQNYLRIETKEISLHKYPANCAMRNMEQPLTLGQCTHGGPFQCSRVLNMLVRVCDVSCPVGEDDFVHLHI